MVWSDDPMRDADRYEAERQEEEDKLPICDVCGEPIQDEWVFELDDGTLVCGECLNREYRKPVEDYIET